jgi:hypothetical protein
MTLTPFITSTDFSVPSPFPTMMPTESPTLPSDTNSNDDTSSNLGGLSETYWIVIAVGGFAVLATIAGYGWWHFLKLKTKKRDGLLDGHQTSV